MVLEMHRLQQFRDAKPFQHVLWVYGEQFRKQFLSCSTREERNGGTGTFTDFKVLAYMC